VESSSVRILFDGDTTIECAVCDRTIERHTRYRHLILRNHDGTIEEQSVCEEDCALDTSWDT
jgi:hypothetical protein